VNLRDIIDPGHDLLGVLVGVLYGMHRDLLAPVGHLQVLSHHQVELGLL
jgi:hypothetical protein